MKKLCVQLSKGQKIILPQGLLVNTQEVEASDVIKLVPLKENTSEAIIDTIYATVNNELH